MPLISQTAEYALRAAVVLANNATEKQTVAGIAAATQVPADYLSKVLQQLTRSGLIVSQRGVGGGFRLSKTAASISVLDIVQAVDSLERIQKCPLGIREHTELCPLHAKLDAAIAHVESAFAGTTLADLTTGTDVFCKNNQAAKL